jgi:mitochondrial fission protein ELM1
MKKIYKVSKNISNDWDYLVNYKNNLFSKVFNFFVNFIVLKIINKEFANIIIKKIKRNYKIIEFGCGRATTSLLISSKKKSYNICY